MRFELAPLHLAQGGPGPPRTLHREPDTLGLRFAASVPAGVAREREHRSTGRWPLRSRSRGASNAGGMAKLGAARARRG